MGVEVSTGFQIFKRNWNISISSSAIEFWLILGVPWGVGGWVDLGGGGERVPPHMCTHMHLHIHACTYDIIGNSPGFPQCGAAICMKLSCLLCMHVHACMHMHVHMCGAPSNHPHPHPTTPIQPPLPQSCRQPKSPKFNNSWTNRDNLILFWRFFTFEHSWTHIDYSWSPQTPHPPAPPLRAKETQIRRITITLERIKIIQFCLKI